MIDNMPEPKKETIKKGKAEIWDDIDDNSIEEMLKVGRILPSLKPRLNTIYVVKVIGIPKGFDSKAFGKAHSIDILHETMKKSIVLAKSFRQQLRAEMIREKLIDNNNEPDFNKLIGKTLTFQKALGDTKTMTDVPLYSVQID